MENEPTTDGLTGRQIAGVVGGVIVAAAVVVILTLYVAGNFLVHNPDDPLTKAGGLKAEQLK